MYFKKIHLFPHSFIQQLFIDEVLYACTKNNALENIECHGVYIIIK